MRIAAIAAAKQTLDHNADYLKKMLQTGIDVPMVGLFHQLLALLNDASATVRMTAAKALGGWASYAGCEALDSFLERENELEACEALAMANALCDPTLKDDDELS